MARNELCINIPSYFKCPISMEVMKSPVSLSTGITYDRCSIQRWLESGHTTCPSTMQNLSSPSYVPNLTLLRLMQLWPSLTPPSPRYNLVKSDFLRMFLNQAKSSDENCMKFANSDELVISLRKLHDQANRSEEFSKVLVSCEDFLEGIIRLISMFDYTAGKLESLELMLILLNLVLNDNIGTKLNKLINCLPKLVYALHNGSIEAKISTARILRKIVMSGDGETKRIMIETPSLIPKVYNLIKLDNDHAIEAGMSMLVLLVRDSRSAKKELISLGIVKRVVQILCDAKRVYNKLVIERLMELLETMATCSEGRKAISGEEGCVEEIMRRLMKVSEKATEHGVTVIWSLCYMFKDEKVVDVVASCNGVGKVLLLLQSNCKPVVKQMCADLFKVLRVSGKSPPCMASYVTKTTHIMPC